MFEISESRDLVTIKVRDLLKLTLSLDTCSKMYRISLMLEISESRDLVTTKVSSHKL